MNIEKSIPKTKPSLLGDWFESSNCDSVQMKILFENIPGVSFFVKDANHRLIAVNNGFLPRLGLSSEDELFGKTDFDLFATRLAEQYRREGRKDIGGSR